MEAMRRNMTRLQDMLRQMQEQQQAYEAARRTKAMSAPILQYSAGYVPPQVHPQVTAQPFPPQAAQAPVYFAGQHQPPGQAPKLVAEGALALQAQLQAFLQQLNQPHCISSTTPSARPEGNTSQGFGANQAPIQAAMTWSQLIFDSSMAAQQVPPVGAGQPNAMAQPHAQAAISPFTTPYPQQGAVNRAGGKKGLPLSGGIKTRPIPPQFKFPPVPRYSGETDPKEFLSIYESAIEAAHGDENTKAKVIHLALDGITRSWYFNLPANSIYSWEQLRDVFVLNFRGTYKEQKTQQHLLGIRQRSRESIREYMRRFSQARCQVQDITDATPLRPDCSRTNSQEKSPTRSHRRSSTYFASLTGSQGVRRIPSDDKLYKLSTTKPPSPLLKLKHKFKLPNHLPSLFASLSRQSKDSRRAKAKPP
uniref:Retrotransposon protein, putative, Ty3-gypsy subclass n=1 Tax=Oryza sativa subsp. japonica TaxID=39947 RepID=Q33A36_ORYSJ|nr:retrotransposon protein, putative, Ty3-gypsy subclass [Oryza sativa Japonica Group]